MEYSFSGHAAEPEAFQVSVLLFRVWSVNHVMRMLITGLSIDQLAWTTVVRIRTLYVKQTLKVKKKM